MSRESEVNQILTRLERHKLLGIATQIAEQHFMTITALLGRMRTAPVARAKRQLYTELRATGLSLPEIGILLDRDHTTILYGMRPLGSRKLKRPNMVARVNKLEEEVVALRGELRDLVIKMGWTDS